jgi:hypothetical protein
MALLLLAGGLFGKARKANQLTGITASVERDELRMPDASVCVNL